MRLLYGLIIVCGVDNVLISKALLGMQTLLKATRCHVQ